MDHSALDERMEMAVTPGVHSYSFNDVEPCAHVIGLQPTDDPLLRGCTEHVDHSHAQGHLLEHVSDPKDCEIIL